MRLPTYQNTIENYELRGQPLVAERPSVLFNREVFAAAHVVTEPMADYTPWLGRPVIDWESTLNFRHYLWDQGLGLAEAMDTSQRGMGLDWKTAKELIQISVKEAKKHPLKPRVACGAGTDQYDIEDLDSEQAIIKAYSEQMEAIEAAGGQIILMASRAMARLNYNNENSHESYLNVYGHLISQAKNKVILHWLGEMFDPQLKGYWGSEDLDKAEKVVLELIGEYADKIDGIKISLLDKDREKAFRKELPDNVRLYTGDDFNYPELIDDELGFHSHALLGIFAAIAPVAAQALSALALNDREEYYKLLNPTVTLSREIFKAPTQYYKSGVAFLAWLNGQQKAFIMPKGLQSSRGIVHYAEVFRLADQARLLSNPELAQKRMQSLLTVYGISY